MRSEYSIEVLLQKGENCEQSTEEKGAWECTRQGRKCSPQGPPDLAQLGRDVPSCALFSELPSAESTYCTSASVLIRGAEDLTTNLGKIKVYLKPQEKELFI